MFSLLSGRAMRRVPMVLMGVLAVCLSPSAEGALWLVVDTESLTLTVLDAGKTVRRYDGIAIGRGGAGSDKRGNDDRTPLGEYRITHVTTNSDFHIFIGINYPNLDDAERGRAQGLISGRDFDAIRNAVLAGRQPPQDTALGGHIGIHGLGAGDPGIHAVFNWTNGCVALTNEQIADLAARIQPGTRVVIR